VLPKPPHDVISSPHRVAIATPPRMDFALGNIA
jgi:hypothetical protein